MVQITRRGEPVNTCGELPPLGSVAPDFRLVAEDLSDKSLADFAGKKKLLYIVPSLDTPTCARSTKFLNENLAGRGDVVVLIASADLPFAMQRFCEAESLAEVVILSMMRTRQFAKDYGVLMVDGPLEGITARALLALDEDNVIRYAELTSEVADEPDYDAALAALTLDKIQPAGE